MSQSNPPVRRLIAVQPPIIPLIGSLIDRTPGTISFGQGVVGYGPPPEAVEAAARFWDDLENHKYGDVEGVPALIDGIEAKLAAENGIRVRPASCVIVTAGGNMAFTHAVQAITDPGDDVILLAPYYFNHDMAVALAGCRTVAVRTDDAGQPDVDRLARAISPNTRAIVTISPNNPTGAVYHPDTLRAINALCAERGVYHISDEIYEYFTYGAVPHFSPGSIADSHEHTISMFSFSKAYGMASSRVGYLVVPDALAPSIAKIQDTVLVCPPHISQHMAIGALRAGPSWCHERVVELAAIRSQVLSALAAIGDAGSVTAGDGALYCWVRVRTALASLAIVERLIAEHRVAALPGSAFGITDGCYLRVGFGALDAETAAEGVRRLARGLRALANDC